MKIKAKNRAGLFLLALALCSCKPDIYERYDDTGDDGWAVNDSLTFTPVIEEPEAFDLSVLLRNDDNYAYNNIWLSLKWIDPAGDTSGRTINMPLATAGGKWLGSGPGSLYDSQMKIETLNLNKPGKYIFILSQFMREDVLNGIHQAGIKLRRKK